MEEDSSAVSCRVSLFEGQELPALLRFPAHDNNTDGGEIPASDDGRKIKPLSLERFELGQGRERARHSAYMGL